MSLNKVMLIGHVGSMEVKSFEGQNGPRKCATFSLATSEKYKDRTGNLVNNTEWHNIVSWNHAEFCEKYVTKGTQLYVEGKLRTRSWDDQNGNKRYVTEVLADSLQFLGKKDGQQTNATEQTSTQQPAQKKFDPHAVKTTPLPSDDDLPGDDLPF